MQSINDEVKRIRLKYNMSQEEAYEKLYFEYKKQLIKVAKKLSLATKIRLNREIKEQENG